MNHLHLVPDVPGLFSFVFCFNLAALWRELAYPANIEMYT